MTFPRRFFFVTLLALASGATVAERFVIGPQREEHAAAEASLARVEASRHVARSRLAALARAGQAADHQLATQRGRLAALEGTPAKLWAARIRLLQQLMAELPAQRIPELRLLDALDWIEIARKAELDTAGNIRTALGTARAVGRRKFAKHLQDALREFTTRSQGELPDHIALLAPLLSRPADAEMLARYALTRTGRIGEADEFLIKETVSADLTLSVSLNGWGLNSGSGALAAPGESDFEAMRRAANVVDSALADTGVAVTAGTESVTAMAENMAQGLTSFAQTYAPPLEAEFGDAFGEELKAAVARFHAAHPDQTLAHLGQLLPHFGQLEKLMTVARPALAHLQYLIDHEFKAPASPAELQPYLERPFDPKLLEHLKVIEDDDSIGLNLALKSMTTNITPVSPSPPTSSKSP